MEPYVRFSYFFKAVTPIGHILQPVSFQFVCVNSTGRDLISKTYFTCLNIRIKNTHDPFEKK